jgi:hypothetical protein
MYRSKSGLIVLTSLALAFRLAPILSPRYAQAANLTKFSEYTSLKDCKILWREGMDERLVPPLTDFESICPGRDGMQVILEGGDARSWIGLLPRSLKYDDGVRFPSQMLNFGAFAIVVGTQLEWRYHGPQLVALIVRMARLDETSDPSRPKDIAGLIVLRVDITKLDQTCKIGQTTSNEEARAIADDLDRPCLGTEQQFPGSTSKSQDRFPQVPLPKAPGQAPDVELPPGVTPTLPPGMSPTPSGIPYP